MNLLIDIMGALVGLTFALIALGAATDYIARIIIN